MRVFRGRGPARVLGFGSRALGLMSALALLTRPTGAVNASDLAKTNAPEQRLLQLLEKHKYIKARESAEAILRQDNDSLIARFALGRVFHEEEANLPRALYHVTMAEKQLVERYGPKPQDEVAKRWHRRILLALEQIFGEMDRRDAQLETIDRYDALYKPSQDHRRIWPLMKLGRFDEAIAIAKKLTLSSQVPTRIAGYNGLLSVEFERERPRRCFKVAMEAVRATGYRSCILALNTAEAAFAVYRFAEVERLAQRSLQAPLKDCPASAHPHLANLFLLRGEFQRAISAVKAARQSPVQRKHRQQFEMGINAWLMRLLYALGRFDKAYELARRVVRSPDRVGLISFSGTLMALIHIVDYHASLNGEIERLRERASIRSISQRAKLWLKIAELRLSAWSARRRADKLLAGTRHLRSILRPYLKPLPPWHTPELFSIAGRGVITTGIDSVRAQESMPKETAPYFDAWSGELAYLDGRHQQALRLAASALRALPADESLLRHRVMAWAAVSALKLGQMRTARDYFDQVLNGWPTVLRLIGAGVPARIEVSDSGDNLVNQVAKRLADSRRLDASGKLGFVARVSRAGPWIQICLSGPKGRRYACSEFETSPKKGQEESVVGAVDAFHRTVFAPRIDLTQQDINSLDGSAVRGTADQVLKNVLQK